MSIRAERCDGCRFWQRGDTGLMLEDVEASVIEDGVSLVGECLRHPPKVSDFQSAKAAEHYADGERNLGTRLLVILQEATVFPVTYDSDWCGEWQANPPA